MKFYELSPNERRNKLTNKAELLSALTEPLTEDIANHLIENQISTAEIPLGVCFVQVDGKNYSVPMATEEPSVIAAANNGAHMAGIFKTLENKRLMSGQIVFYEVENTDRLSQQIESLRNQILEVAESAYPSIYKRGGGLSDFAVETYKSWVSIDCHFDTKDAMGANMIDTMLEAIADFLRKNLTEKILFSILSNEVCDCQTVVEARLSTFEPETAKKIALISDYAAIDSARCATHNKGIMNGVEAAVLALANDTRAIYMANNFHKPLTTWKLKNGELIGQITISLPIGTQGGATSVLPKAAANFEILGTRDAKELASVIAAIGLANNLAALKALVTSGIQKGHMSLQVRSLALSAGAKNQEIDQVASQLKKSAQINLEEAKKILAQIRK